MKHGYIFGVVALVLAAVLAAGCTAPEQAPSAQNSPVETTEATFPPTEPVPTQPEPTQPPFEAANSADTDPALWDTQWEIFCGGESVDAYVREDAIRFDEADDFVLPGVASFRGNYRRQDASYGTADITDGTIHNLWNMYVGFLEEPGWGGCCWTGQPLVVQWDAETRAIMNLYEAKKDKEDLVEVIYAKMDGKVHFFDMEDGSATRDPVYIGMAFKGAGTLDPRGYPILYVGAGLDGYKGYQRFYAISLIDGSILYDRNGCESITNRWWFGFDGAPVVDSETDTLIWAGESGIIYSIKLNTRYDKAAGTLSMNPEEPVMTCYSDDYTRIGRNNGYESSITAVENYLYIGNNAGLLHCVDVNTMELVWAQDLVDDVNGTAVFEWGEDGNGYLYTGPSMDYSRYGCDMPMSKIDARTGEVVWQYNMPCGTMDGVPGGLLASPLLGRAGSDIENLIIFSVGCSPNVYHGQVVALDKQSGQVVWQFETANYMWSSPVALYDENGNSYIFQADSRGKCSLLEGATGQLLDQISLKATTEASPVAFDNHIVLGTRSGIYLLEIT